MFGTTTFALSDKRLKSNERPSRSALDLIKQIRREKRMAIRKYQKVNYAIEKMKQYHFLNIRFRHLKYIDESHYKIFVKFNFKIDKIDI